MERSSRTVCPFLPSTLERSSSAAWTSRRRRIRRPSDERSRHVVRSLIAGPATWTVRSADHARRAQGRAAPHVDARGFIGTSWSSP
jgi:hypothetical protein